LVSIGIAMAVFHMPLGETLNAGVYGSAVSVLAILWITFNAIWIYNLTVKSGHFAVLRRAFATISDDRRIQSIVIAFSFGALLESLAGGGSPIAICAVMLIAIGFSPIKAATVALVANTAPVAFGGLGNPITIIGQVTELPAEQFGAMAGRQVRSWLSSCHSCWSGWWTAGRACVRCGRRRSPAGCPSGSPSSRSPTS